MKVNETSFFVGKIKIILLGDPTVGKTSVIGAIRELQFQEKQQATIGIDFFAKIITKNDKSYKLQFWDTAGQERFRSIIPSYVRNANIGILVFDVQNKHSYQNITNWLEIFRENAPENSIIIVVANKVDVDERKVSTQEAERKFQKQNVKYLQISAKTGFQIDKLIQLLVMCIDVSECDIVEQEMRAKSYTKLQKLVQQLPIIMGKNKKCCII